MMPFYFVLMIQGLFFLALSACDGRKHHSAQGYVVSEDIYVTSSHSGILHRLPVKRGMQIQKGDLIFQLDANPEALEILETENVLMQEKEILQDLKSPKRQPERDIALEQLEQATARLSLAKLRTERFQMLYAKKAGTLDEADAAKYRFDELSALQKQR